MSSWNNFEITFLKVLQWEFHRLAHWHISPKQFTLIFKKMFIPYDINGGKILLLCITTVNNAYTTSKNVLGLQSKIFHRNKTAKQIKMRACYYCYWGYRLPAAPAPGVWMRLTSTGGARVTRPHYPRSPWRSRHSINMEVLAARRACTLSPRPLAAKGRESVRRGYWGNKHALGIH